MTYFISELADALQTGKTTARELMDACLAAIDCEDGRRAYMTVYEGAARAAADDIDRQRAAGAALPPYAGIPLSIKDLFDEAGVVTRAGSKLLNAAPAASRDATVVARLRAAGFIVIGRTNMTEFAFSGLGMNPHYGHPRSPFDRDNAGGRISGGSSSGSAVSISDGMAAATIGSDTGGSTRAPAAFCGIVGFKPTAGRMPATGVYPLSTSFDAAGPMGNSAACCAILDDIMAGGTGVVETPFPVRGLRIAVPRGYLFEGLDPAVSTAFEAGLSRLAAAGAVITDISIDILESVRPANNPKSIVAAEAYHHHEAMMADPAQKAQYDPYIALRIMGGQSLTAADYINAFALRDRTKKEVQQITRPFDVLALPTSPIIPPMIADMKSSDDMMKTSGMTLRNTTLSNYLDRPTISIPCHPEGGAPVGFSLMGSHKHDRRLLAIAMGCEAHIRG